MGSGNITWQVFILLILAACYCNEVQSRPPRPLPDPVDISDTLRRIERLKRGNETKNANTIKLLLDRVRSVNPDFFANETSLSTYADILSVSTKYQNLGCDMVAATRFRNSTTYLTFFKLADGLGNFVVQLIKALAFTYQRGWNFLGVQGKMKVSLGNHEDDILNFYFGNHEPLLTSPELFPNNTKVITLGAKLIEQCSIIAKGKIKNNVIYNIHTTRFDLEKYIDKQRSHAYKHEVEYLIRNQTTHHNRTYHEITDEFVKNKTNEFISPVFLSHLRTHASCGVNKALAMVKREGIDQEPPSAIKVVAHIRIGDVLLNAKFDYKKIPLEYYPLIFSLIRRICPLCKLYAFTSVQDTNQMQSIQPIISELESMAVTVYIDQEYSKNSTDLALNTIAHFSTADVFITAKSEFSLVAAYLNPNCVIYSTYAANFPLHEWMVIPFMAVNGKPDTMLRVIENNLPLCIEKKLALKKSI